MTEVLGHNPEQRPLKEWQVDSVTAFALREYMDQCDVDLSAAVGQMIEFGLLSRDLRDLGLVIKEAYPGEAPSIYIANEEIYDDIKNVDRIISELDPKLGEHLEKVAAQRNLNQDDAFSSLVEDARNFLMPFWRGAQVFATNEEGLKVELKGPNQKN